MSESILTVTGISKVFPGVQALRNVDFELRRGEIRALVGKNGAGKSTLIKIITGIYNHDEGTLSLDGREIAQITPKKMHDLGIRAIYQTNELVPYFTVGESIMLNNEPRKLGGLIVDKKRCYQVARDILENQLGVQIDPYTLIRDLDVSQQQLVQIAKNLVGLPKVMIFDEPTASLSAHEINQLFEIIKNLRSKGVSVIYISHRFEEVFDIADSITILRDGSKIADLAISETTEDEVILLMVGEEATELPAKRTLFRNRDGGPILKVHKLTSRFFKDVSFELNRGEILGIFGGEGSGHEKMAQALFGQHECHDGWIEFEGKQIRPGSPGEAISLGIGYMPRDRKEEGLIIDFDVRENVSAPTLPLFSSFGIIDSRKEDEAAKQQIADLLIKTPSTRTLVAALSGGNQQKVVIGRWIVAAPKILLLDYPTSGIDVRAKTEVYSILMNLTERGVSIILVSPEYEETAILCDRVLVMRRGLVVKEFFAHEFNEQDMLRHAIGSVEEGVTHD